MISTVGMFQGAVKLILKDRDRAEPLLSAEQMDEIKLDFRRLAPSLGLMVAELSAIVRKPMKSKAGPTSDAHGADPRAFGSELVETARRYRAEGLSVAATAARMQGEGHQVSKSWVQKWTAQQEQQA